MESTPPGQEARPDARSSGPESIRGRGAAANPANRFEPLRYDYADPDGCDADEGVGEAEGGDQGSTPRTLYLRDPARSLISFNESPDIPFDASINPYRGCEHGCIYCYARPSHEYLGLSAGLDFETRILVKEDAPELLRRELASRRWRPQVLALAGVTDPYQPIERRTRLTRRLLEVLVDCRNPVGVITKSALVTRDIDLLQALHRHRAVSVSVSITTLDPELHRAMEPRAAAPQQRLRAIEALARAGLPANVMVAPVIPGLTDHEIPAILRAAAEAGASTAGYIVLRLPHGVAPLFADWLARHRPERRQKVLGRVLAMRGGRMNDPSFGTRMRGEGVFADQVRQLFELARRRCGLEQRQHTLSVDAFRPPSGPQGELFRS